MAQGVPDATFAAGCDGTRDDVSGSVFDFLAFLKTNSGCQVRDKLYTFQEGAFDDFNPTSTILQISQSLFNPLEHAIKLSSTLGFQPGDFDFDYNIAVVGSPLYIKSWFASAEPASLTSKYTLTTDSDKSGNAVVVFPGMSISPEIFTTDLPTSVAFTNRLSVAAGKPGPNGFTNTVLQSERSSEVPGPLPLLGAAAAFGFSRKLRARIKTMA